MKKQYFHVIAIVLLLAACSPALPADGEIISWDYAIELLVGGHVTMVAELHSGEVQLTLTNGSTVRTLESPYSGAIFDEVQACGQPCADVVIAME